MPGTRKPYPPEFREQLLALVRAGRSPEELSRELEPSAQSISNWVAQADRDEGKRKDGLTSVDPEEHGILPSAGRRLIFRCLRKPRPADLIVPPDPNRGDAVPPARRTAQHPYEMPRRS